MASYMPSPLASTPPVLPPKPASHDTSRISTPTSAQQFAYAPGAEATYRLGAGAGASATGQTAGEASGRPAPAQSSSTAPDPGDMWLPQVLQDKSKQDIAEMLASSSLLSAVTNSPASIHPSLQASHQGLQTSLAENMDLGNQLVDLESRLAHQRSATQAQLLSTHTLERQWRQKQSDMDHALAPFSPASLYQQLGQGVQEQALVCQAMEESFLEGDGEGAPISEREAAEWIRKYRDAKVQCYLRQERKERWDEGRVGGWR